VHFLLRKARLHSFQHLVDDAKQQLEICHRILNFPGESTDIPDKGLTNCNNDTSAQLMKSPAKDECFGFVCDEKIEGSAETEFISLYRDVPDVTEVCRCRPECTCIYCHDIILLRLRIDLRLAYSDTFRMLGHPAPEKYFTDLQCILEHLSLKINICINKIYNISFSGLVDMKPSKVPSDFYLKLQHAKLNIQKCHSALSEGSLEFTNWGLKSLNLLSLDANPDMVSHPHLLAEVFYLLAPGALQQCRIMPVDGDVDDLADGIATMHLDCEVKPKNACAKRVRFEDVRAKLAEISISDSDDELKNEQCTTLRRICGTTKTQDSLEIYQMIQQLEEAEDEDLFVEADDSTSAEIEKKENRAQTIEKKENRAQTIEKKENSAQTASSCQGKKEIIHDSSKDCVSPEDGVPSENGVPSSVGPIIIPQLKCSINVVCTNSGKSESNNIPVANRGILELKGSKDGAKLSPMSSSSRKASSSGEVITASYRTPARRIRKNQHLVDPDSSGPKTITPAKQILKSGFKTPGNKVKKSVSIEASEAPRESIDMEALAELRQVFKTPSSVCRRTALDLLMASDSDEEDSCMASVKSTQRQRMVRTGSVSSRKATTQKAIRVKAKKSDASKVAKAISFDLETNVEDIYGMPLYPPAISVTGRKGPSQRETKLQGQQAGTCKIAKTSSPELASSGDVCDLPRSPANEKKKVTRKPRCVAKRVPVHQKAATTILDGSENKTGETFMLSSGSSSHCSDSQSLPSSIGDTDPNFTSSLKPMQTRKGRGRGKKNSDALTSKTAGRLKRGMNQTVESGDSQKVELEVSPDEKFSGRAGKRKGLSVEERNIPADIVVEVNDNSSELIGAKITKFSRRKKDEILAKEETISSDVIVESEIGSVEPLAPKTTKGPRRKKAVEKTLETSTSPLRPRRTRGRGTEQFRTGRTNHQIEADDIVNCIDLFSSDLELCSDVCSSSDCILRPCDSLNESNDLYQSMSSCIQQDVEVADMLVDEPSYDCRLSLDDSIEVFRAGSDEEERGKGNKKPGRRKKAEKEIPRAMRAVQTTGRRAATSVKNEDWKSVPKEIGEYIVHGTYVLLGNVGVHMKDLLACQFEPKIVISAGKVST
jgi:hypothetical protein